MITLIHNGSTAPIASAIELPGSKSESHRLLILCAIAGIPFGRIQRLSDSRDTLLMREALESQEKLRYLKDAGTPLRLLLAYFAIHQDRVILDGTQRLRNRPIQPLLDALASMGAELNCLEQPGALPVEIVKGVDLLEEDLVLAIDGQQSSQFASALLLGLPMMKGRKTLMLQGEQVSKPYIHLTIQMMRDWGVEVKEHEGRLIIEEQTYRSPEQISVEADWSAASYFYAAVAIGAVKQLQLLGLRPHSLQGDAACVQLFQRLGVETQWEEGIAQLQYTGKWDLTHPFHLQDHPDLAPSIIWAAAYLRLPARFSGIEHLRWKESDRIAALQSNLKQVGVELHETQGMFHLRYGTHSAEKPVIQSFDDHRMLMSAAIWGFKQPIDLENETCVEKSFPTFWKEWTKLNFAIAAV